MLCTQIPQDVFIVKESHPPARVELLQIRNQAWVECFLTAVREDDNLWDGAHSVAIAYSIVMTVPYSNWR